MRMPRTCLACLAFTIVLALAAGSAAAAALDLGEAGVLHFPVPKKWTLIEGKAVGPHPTWEIQPTDSGGAVFLVTALWGAPTSTPLNLSIRSEAQRDALLIGTEPPELFVTQGSEATVAWYATTDPNDTDGPEDYAFQLRAQVDVGSLRLSATLLHHQPDVELRQAILWMLANSRHEQTGPWSGERRLRLGDRPWALVLPVDGFQLEPTTKRQGGEGLALAGAHESSGLVLSAVLEQTEEKLDGEGWRDRQRKRIAKGPLPASKVRVYELHGHPVLQYDARWVLGQ